MIHVGQVGKSLQTASLNILTAAVLFECKSMIIHQAKIQMLTGISFFQPKTSNSTTIDAEAIIWSVYFFLDTLKTVSSSLFFFRY